jgi:tetratricopeptide (TPR) repeat protein
MVACVCLCSSLAAAQLGQAQADLSLGKVEPLAVAPALEARSNALAHYAAAKQLESEGRVRDALTHYRQVVAADPGNAELVAHTAELVLSYESREAAVRLLEQCVQTSPNDGRAYISLARFHHTYPATKDAFASDLAAKVLTEALAKLPGNIALYKEAVMMHLTRNQRADAEKVMQQAVKQPAREPEFWIETGRIAQQIWPLSHPEKKEEHRARVNPFFEKALKLAPVAREDVRLAVAQYYLLSNQLDRAAEVTEEAARLNHSVEAKKLLVRLYQTLDREPDAITLLEEILKGAPNDVENRRLLVTIYERQESFEKAVPHAEALIQAGGGTAEDYMSLGILLLRSGRTEKALQLSQRTLALFPNNARFTFQAALAQRSLRRYEDSLRLYEKTESLAQGTSPELLNDGFYQSWADTLQSAERHDEAAKKYQRAIDLTPEGDPARAATVLNNLGYMWLEQGKNLDKAGEFIRKANELEPRNPVYLDSLGWFHYLKGNYQEALKTLLEVQSMIPKLTAQDAEIIDHIAQTYLKLGDKPAALEYFKRALELDPGNSKIKQRYEEAQK